MLRGINHYVEYSADERLGHGIMKEITHGVDKDGASPRPPKRGINKILVYGHSKARPRRTRVPVVLILGLPHGLKALGERERIAVVTAGRRAVAARGWVPRNLGPLDRTSRHGHRPQSRESASLTVRRCT